MPGSAPSGAPSRLYEAILLDEVSAARVAGETEPRVWRDLVLGVRVRGTPRSRVLGQRGAKKVARPLMVESAPVFFYYSTFAVMPPAPSIDFRMDSATSADSDSSHASGCSR